MTAPQPAVHRGIVKQILSGDAVIIRGQPRGGPPPERTICLSNVTAPRLARRANPNLVGSVETQDEPYAWEAREFLRKKLIGKSVTFTVEYTVPGSGREYGCLFLAKDGSTENITESIVSEGLVEVRRGGLKPNDEGQQKLIQLEDTAKSAGVGKWAEGTASEHVRKIVWNLENPRNFVDSHHGKPVDAVIEHVRDGCTVRAFILPSFHHVTIMMAGIKCPMFKMGEDGKQVPEPFAEEAKFFTEVRLLQRDVKIYLEGVSNQNILGSVEHPNGNITELLLKDGFARCVDWSMGVVSQGPEKLRGAEKLAKAEKKRIWKNYTPSVLNIDVKDRNFTAKVVEVVNGDALNVKLADNTVKKIFLSSVRPPRTPVTEETEVKKDPKVRSRPLYDIPFMYEAREFMRTKLIGKRVNVLVDYVQPPSGTYPEKTCCTVTIGGINVGEALVSKGFATVIRYRQDDDQRSSHYDELLSAEARAQKKAVGLHSKKEHPIHRVADIAGDAQKSRQFLPFLQKAGRCKGIVEFVASGSRARVFIGKETCLITLLLSGIDCPRGTRPGPGGVTLPGEPYGDQAAALTKENCLQREVEVEVEACDKGGNFIGWMFVDGQNMSVNLVEQGFAKVHFTAERSNYYSQLKEAEDKAKVAKLNVWTDYEEPKEVAVVEEPAERKVSYKNIFVTEVAQDEMVFYGQLEDDGPKVEKLMEELRTELTANTPVVGAYTPKKGDLCAAKFTDGEWYRARVQKVEAAGKVQVFYIDYGNKESTASTNLAALPSVFAATPPMANQYSLACTKLPEDEDAKSEAIDALFNDILNKQCLMNVEYKGTCDSVSLLYADNREDVAQTLIGEGLLLVEPRREKRLQKLVDNYTKAQEKAKSARLNLWRYGDFTGDDAKEFGYQR